MSGKDPPPFGDRRRSNGFLVESVGFTVAEGVSMGVSLVTVGLLDTLAPGMVKKATKVVAKTVIEPHLDTIERTMKKVCHIEECRVSDNQSREERAESLARAIVLFTPAWFLSMGAKVYTREKMNKHYDIKDGYINPQKTFMEKTFYKVISPYAWKIFVADEGMHYGSLIYLNTRGAEYTSDMIKATSNMLQKQVGMSKRKADDLASMAMIWELPNVLGWGAAMGMIFGKHRWGWGDQRRSRLLER